MQHVHDFSVEGQVKDKRRRNKEKDKRADRAVSKMLTEQQDEDIEIKED